MPGILTNLAGRLTSKTLPPVKDVDGYFSRSIEKALKQRLVRCAVGPLPGCLPDLERRKTVTVMAEHNERVRALEEEEGRRRQQEWNNRVQARFALDAAAHNRARWASLRGAR
jgi:hypothetical protein